MIVDQSAPIEIAAERSRATLVAKHENNVTKSLLLAAELLVHSLFGLKVGPA
jgi:hypothetical protein